MRDRNTQEKDSQDTQATVQPAVSIKELKNKIFANQQAVEANSQKSNSQSATTKKDLEGLRKRTVTAPVANQPAEIKSDTQKPAEELRGSNHIAALRERLFTAPPTSAAPSLQKQTTLDDMKRLKAAEGHVRAKAKELEVFFTHSRKALDVVKNNKVSADAKVKLTIPKDLKIFENQQVVFIDEVRHQLEEDIREFSENPKLRELGYARFLELAFVYRSYEVCLEQDLRRHAANRLKKSGVIQNEEGKNQMDLLTGIPSQMAVESLNYYGDFYKNLKDIENIWPNAGIIIRKAELRSTFAARFSIDINRLLTLLGDKNTEEWRLARSLFDNEFAQFVSTNSLFKNYIEKGDGLDTENHPWKQCGFYRLPQPNASINFKDLVPVDDAHRAAVRQVEERVETDKQTILPRLG